MAHTIDHDDEAVRIQESIAARDNNRFKTGQQPKPSYAERMGASMVNAWEGAKRIDNKWDPFEYAASAAAHSIEFMVPQTQKELLFELATLGQGSKIKLGSKLVRKAISKGVEPAFQKGKQVIGDLLNPKQMQLAEAGVGNVKSSNVLQSKSYTAQSGNAEIIRRQQLDKPLSADIDPDEMIRRQTLEPPGFRMDRKQIKAEIVKLQDKGMSLEDAKKQLLGDGETFWIDNRTGEPISIQYNSKDPNNPHMVGWWSRGKRGGKRTLLTEQQSIAPGETAFTRYNAKTNKVELLVKKGDEIHHWNSIIDKSSAYVGLSTQEAKELTGLVREAGWMFGDNKANLIKMIRSDHKKIHAFMRENGIEGLTARKMMEKLYAGKSVKERFKILRGFMEHVQGAVDEELVRMGYQIPPSHAAAQAANREVLKTIKMP